MSNEKIGFTVLKIFKPGDSKRRREHLANFIDDEQVFVHCINTRASDLAKLFPLYQSQQSSRQASNEPQKGYVNYHRYLKSYYEK